MTKGDRYLYAPWRKTWQQDLERRTSCRRAASSRKQEDHVVELCHRDDAARRLANEEPGVTWLVRALLVMTATNRETWESRTVGWWLGWLHTHARTPANTNGPTGSRDLPATGYFYHSFLPLGVYCIYYTIIIIIKKLALFLLERATNKTNTFSIYIQHIWTFKMIQGKHTSTKQTMTMCHKGVEITQMTVKEV